MRFDEMTHAVYPSYDYRKYVIPARIVDPEVQENRLAIRIAKHEYFKTRYAMTVFMNNLNDIHQLYPSKDPVEAITRADLDTIAKDHLLNQHRTLTSRADKAYLHQLELLETLDTASRTPSPVERSPSPVERSLTPVDTSP